MRIDGIPFSSIDWSTIPSQQVAGERGSATMRIVTAGEMTIRIVEYSPGYLSDHWCTRGHIVQVLDGRCIISLRDGRRFPFEKGMGMLFSDEMDPHQLETGEDGCTIFIVD